MQMTQTDCGFRISDFGLFNPKFAIRNSQCSHGGQVVMEYFILFAVVGLLTLIGLTTFDDDIKTNLERFVNAAAAKIAN